MTVATADARPRLRIPPLLQRLMHRPLAVCAISFLALVILAVVLAQLIAPYGPNAQDLLNTYTGPTRDHLLGTDELGRDMLSRLLYGGRVSLLGVAVAVSVLLVLGVTTGVIAGYIGGWLERGLSWFADLVLALPAIIILLVVLTIFGRDETSAMVALGILASPGLMRVVRGATLAIRQELYVSAARVSGLSRFQILLRHILPRVTGPIIVQTSIAAATALLIETGIGYLGLGIAPPTPSWGNLIADASNAIYQQPWLLVPTGLTVGLVALAFGVLGDAVHDATAERTTVQTKTSPRSHGTLPSADKLNPGPARHNPAALLSVANLSIGFPGPAGMYPVATDINIDVMAGETVGIVGESGCGKTVTALAIMGLLPGGGKIVSGQVLFGGKDLARLSQRELRRLRGAEIAYVAQDPIASLDPVFTVGAQVAEVVRTHARMSRAVARARAMELLRMVQLPSPERVAARYPHELSGGMAQRVGIAMALAGGPRLLIADEPTTALDVTVQAEILELLRSLQNDTGMAVILVSHDWGVVADLCRRVVVMYAGQVVEQAAMTQVFDEPLHPYTQGLLRSDPHRADVGARLPAIPGAVPPPQSWPVGCHFHPRCPYATEECTCAAIPLLAPVPEHETRCIHYEQLLQASVSSPVAGHGVAQ